MKSAISRFPLASFFAMAFLFSWIAVSPLILNHELPIQPFQIAGAYGPFLAAFIVTAAMGRENVNALLRRMTNFRFGLGWYLLAIFGYVLLYLLVTGLSGAPLMTSLTQKWSLILTVYLPALFTSYLINPIGEETGRQALPCLIFKRGSARGSLPSSLAWYGRFGIYLAFLFLASWDRSTQSVSSSSYYRPYSHA